MKAIYKCEDFTVENNTLTIWGAELIGMVKDTNGFNKVYETFCKGREILPNAFICPELVCEQRGIDLVVFEK